MTQNQIAYWNLQETKRSNVAKEQETSRHNVATEKESERHNTVSEGEVGRHNRETERFNISQLQESHRHNVATENLGQMQLNESVRHNTVSEQQNDVANLIKSRANDINQAYNNAIISLRKREYTLASEKEIQRIQESQRDFNEAVRMNDAKLIIDAFDSGSDAVRTIFGNKGIVGAGVVGAGVAGTATAAHRLRTDIFKPGAAAGAKSVPTTGTFDLFLVPKPAIDIFMNTELGLGSNGKSNVMRN